MPGSLEQQYILTNSGSHKILRPKRQTYQQVFVQVRVGFEVSFDVRTSSNRVVLWLRVVGFLNRCLLTLTTFTRLGYPGRDTSIFRFGVFCK